MSTVAANHLLHWPDVRDIRSLLGFDRALLLKLAACDWIAEAAILLLTGASGLGKSWLACAIRHKVCRENMSVLHTRAPDSSPIWPSPMGMSVAFATPWGMTAICALRSPHSHFARQQSQSGRVWTIGALAGYLHWNRTETESFAGPRDNAANG